MKKPAIPTVPHDSEKRAFYTAIKECLETIMGRRNGIITKLNANASNDEIIAKVNEIIERLQ